ncbi:(d)CMP kinase [Georgenia sp. TF02-10]|uniref:(d)CMP kinase n=1 Tax=Georgenia sp. TF02-10 TaxID=2917725 RepID=UPI001FA78206|nr:(d)CMP kinase [Georgenia sp. TF02-10]UNX56213.1 (d)CMP kinase [Georgenia sp. TF02-10]
MSAPREQTGGPTAGGPQGSGPHAPAGGPQGPTAAGSQVPAAGAPHVPTAGGGRRGKRGLVVAIDGPSGSGKSTVSRRLASELALAYLDTGATYRAATWWCQRRGVDLDDVPAVAAAVRALPLTMVTDPADPRVICDGVDVTTAIRTAELSAVVSKVATNLEVRAELRRRQRAIIEAEATDPGATAGGRGVVAEGRDITTVVAPDADVRILLVADEDARLARRARELHGAADAASIAVTRDVVVRRDADDATVSAFFTAADGVVTIDSSGLGREETFAAVLAAVRAATEEAGR